MGDHKSGQQRAVKRATVDTWGNGLVDTVQATQVDLRLEQVSASEVLVSVFGEIEEQFFIKADIFRADRLYVRRVE